MEITQEFSPALETAEAIYWSKLFHSNQKLKTFRQNFAGGVACALPAVDILAFNRVTGAGILKPLHDKELKNIIAFYKNAGVQRFFLQLPPYALDPKLEETLLRFGFRHHNNWVKLARPAMSASLPPENKLLEVREVRKTESLTYGFLIARSFGWPDLLADFFAASVGLPGYQHYFSLLNDHPVAAAAWHAEKGNASMSIAGTLSPYRSLGAQQLLLSHRIARAQETGCRIIISETGEDSAEKPNQSYRNMIKMGFEKVYSRKNFIFEC